jgi:REP element-mobilizing transposase RayT
MSRGNAKQRIFTSDRQAQRFLVLLASAASRFGVLCHCFCLMPNHFHLLLRPGAQPIARMMQQLNSAYSQFFNRDAGSVGHVLQGRYKALLVDRETYFLQVVRYIVLNPVRAGLVVDPAGRDWSSYRALAGLADCGKVLEPTTVWRTFDDGDVRAAQAKFVDFVGQGDPEPPSEPVFIGSDDLAARVAVVISPQQAEREFTYAERFAGRPSLAKLFENGIEIRSLDASMHEAFWRYAYTLNEIGAFLGCHPSTVAKRIRRSQSDPMVDTVSDLGASRSGVAM